jgi:hypothetical protein
MNNAQVGYLVIEEGLPPIYLRFDPFFHGERKIFQVQSEHAPAALGYGGDTDGILINIGPL